MTRKLTSRQQAQLAFLETVPPTLDRIRRVVEALAISQADEVMLRQMARLLDEIKAGAQAQGFAMVSEAAGLMSSLSRRGGGLQMKVRGLRELLSSLSTNFEGAMRQATAEETPAGEES